ncbi:endonuclease V [Rubinisphaera margarita]|uniref:endonuclease V n=1 Tax=Rubinisphaera margarita TaxID=2909586 RepID=UPI001EE97E8C|nr:endonuclease V [Rubinisphaera margarita]MCG6157835.1 endonuclease V [Rubinisphaera margarita]
MRFLPDLHQELTDLLQQVPSGRVTTFGRLALALGDRHAARWIATVLRHDVRFDASPWHRVVRLDGSLPGTSRPHSPSQLDLLLQEDVRLKNGRVDSSVEFFEAFQSTRPLQRLHEQQNQQAGQVSLKDQLPPDPTMAGIDVAYPNPGRARAAYVEWDPLTKTTIFERIVDSGVRFPYITGFLSYREIPAYLHLLTDVSAERPLADVLLVDGSGILHPRGIGIASHLGVLLQRPTVGVSKKLLHGSLPKTDDGQQLIEIATESGEIRGAAVKVGPDHKPIYVSPGHGCSVGMAIALVQRSFATHRLPEPVHLADRLSKSQSKR